jgi:hypothetical protein
MPPTFTGIKKTGKMGSILFTSDTSLAKGIEEMPCTVRIEYQDGFAMVGMPERYTLRHLAHEFGRMIPDWGICPRGPYLRDISGAVIHEGTKDWSPKNPWLDFMMEPLPSIQEDSGRGTEIKLPIDQLSILDYWAQAGQEALIGVAFQFNGRTVEYWLPVTIDPSPEEEGWNTYLGQLKTKWMETHGRYRITPLHRVNGYVCCTRQPYQYRWGFFPRWLKSREVYGC